MAFLLSSKPSGCYRSMINEQTQSYIAKALEHSMLIHPNPLPPKEGQIRHLSRSFTESCSCGCGTQTDYGYVIRNLMCAIKERNEATEETIHQCNLKVRQWLTKFEECFEKDKEQY
jgi:hypothetical protein